MPEWLLKDDEYLPKSDQDTFIDKSILVFLKILSRIQRQGMYNTKAARVNATLKIFFTFCMITLISISKNFTFIMIMDIYLIILLSLLKGEEIIKIIKVSFSIAFFTLIILIPSILYGNIYNSVMMILKVFSSVMLVNSVAYTTEWRLITNALKMFFIPDIFILVLDITIKYIVLLGELSLNMLYSLKLRSVGKNNHKHMSLAGIAGTMFIKSKKMADDMYAAMECRGFTGEYRIQKKLTFTFIDFLYIIINVILIFTFIYFERL